MLIAVDTAIIVAAIAVIATIAVRLRLQEASVILCDKLGWCPAQSDKAADATPTASCQLNLQNTGGVRTATDAWNWGLTL